MRFHTFIQALFAPEYPGFAAFAGAGKDGAIDCFHAAGGVVWECKFNRHAGLTEAKARWREVFNHLRDNLADGQPVKGEAQYGPWCNAEQSIQRYLFCFSERLEHEHAVQQLEQHIQAGLAELAGLCGLPHLAQIQVEVWSWDRLAPKLESRPHLRLAWFPDPLPRCFKTLEYWLASGKDGFRGYLTKIPYVPLGSGGPDCAAMLDAFSGADSPVAVLSGAGGTGKSRLLAELAAMAEQRGWLVLLAQPNQLCAADIDALAQLVTDEPVLIGLDYLEKCGQF